MDPNKGLGLFLVLLLTFQGVNTFCDIEVTSLRKNDCAVEFHCRIPNNDDDIGKNMDKVKDQIDSKIKTVNTVNTCKLDNNKKNMISIDFSENGKENVEFTVDLPKDQIYAMNFSYNRIKTLYHKELMLENLIVLDLSHNKISDVDAKSFVTKNGDNNTRNEHCKKKQHGKCAPYDMSSIIYLDLSFNYIKDLRFLPNKKKASFFYKDLRVLKLKANKIEIILDNFHMLPDLKHLDLSDNNIHRMDTQSLAPLRKLQWLDLSRNNLMQQFSTIDFEPITNLTYVNAAYCKALNLPTKLNVKVLDISHNNFPPNPFNARNIKADVVLMQNNLVHWTDIIDIIDSRNIENLLVGSEFQSCLEHDADYMSRIDEIGNEYGVTVYILCKGDEQEKVILGKEKVINIDAYIEAEIEDHDKIKSLIDEKAKTTNTSISINLKYLKAIKYFPPKEENKIKLNCVSDIYMTVVLTIFLVIMIAALMWKIYGVIRIRSLSAPTIFRNKDTDSDITVRVINSSN